MNFIGLKRWVVLVVLSVVVLGLALLAGKWLKSAGTIYIALAGPIEGKFHQQGQELIRSTRLYLDEVNQAGGVHGKRVELLIFDDQGDPEIAKKNAITIAKDKRIVAVKGHYYSTTTLVAGPIYKEFGIPAVTGGAGVSEITKNNDWFFRVIVNNEDEVNFLSSYARNILNKSKAVIVYHPDDAFSQKFAEKLEKSFRSLKGEVLYKAGINLTEDSSAKVETIVNDLVRLNTSPPDVVFTGMRDRFSIQLLAFMKRAGLDYTMVGGSVMAGGTTTINAINAYPVEQVNPGYLSDGIYATSPLIYDIVGEAGHTFRNKFIEKYGVSPGVWEAGSYDAIKVLVQAIEDAGISGDPAQVAADRRKIKDALARINRPELAIEGVDGPIYFDEQGDVVKSVAIGFYRQQNFILALTQLHPTSQNELAHTERLLNWDFSAIHIYKSF